MLCQPRGDAFQQVLKAKNPNTSACNRLLCAACQLAKQRHQGSSLHGLIPITEMLDGLMKDQLLPGQVVSIDQYISVTHGQLGHMKGKEVKSKKFTGGRSGVNCSSG
jgi:hypothetical protein